MSPSSQHLYEFGPYRLDTAERLLLRDGEPVPLTPKAFETLVALVERRGHLVNKDELMKVVWADAFVEESNLTNNVYALRKMLGPGENGRSYIETVPKRGYRFTASVKELLPEALVVEKRTLTRVVTEEAVVDHDSPPRPIIGAREALAIERGPVQTAQSLAWRWLLVAVLGSALVVGGVLIYRSLTPSPALTAAPRPQIESIAVMPFKNESGNPEVEYLSDGMTESLINRLSQLPQLKVIAQNSAFEYKGKDLKPQEVSTALGVQAILTGRLIQRGDDLVVSVELIDARDKTQVWGERYTRKATDVQAIQEEISHVITEKLRLRLTGAQEEQLTRRATQNSQAYQFYLNGLFYLRQPGSRHENIATARDYFERAVGLDPNFAAAWAGMAHANRALSGNSFTDPKEPLARAKAAAEKALELDERFAEAHVELAGIKRDEWDWAGAEQEYKRAIELNPNLVEAHVSYASYLSIMERSGEALAEIKRAQELDPLRASLINQESWLLYIALRYDEAEAKLRHFGKIKPNQNEYHTGMGLIYAARGLYEKAIEEYQQAFTAEYEMPWRRIILGCALARSGKKKDAQVILDKLKTSKQYVSQAELASLYLALGDKEGAMAALERAYAVRDLQLQYLRIDSFLDDLRSDPRFQDLMRRVGLS